MDLLISLIILILVLALVLWVLSLIPLDAKVKQILQVCVAVLVVVWLIASLTGYAPVPVFHHR